MATRCCPRTTSRPTASSSPSSPTRSRPKRAPEFRKNLHAPPLPTRAGHGIIFGQSRSDHFSPGGIASAGHHNSVHAQAWRFVGVAFRAAHFCCVFERVNRRCVSINNDLMINEEIRDREVRVVDQNGAQLGIMSTHQALLLAEERQLDLVKIAPQARPPVCKLMDYGKYRFEQSKREREIRKNQKVITIKEVRLSATIEDHDVDVKFKNAVKFLKDGNKVKVTIRFRGRQITHSEIGREVMKQFAERIKEYGNVERAPLIEGRNMTMLIAPREQN
ncbi:MAG TPA: translation initiation factor IF-3 [Candidatus Pullichristensenella excrementipullorum]|nr:translation initiation factor IF-3 [Candidatus Pullichristensenella excrementipullorum]